MSWLGSSFGYDDRPDEIHTVPPAPRHDVLLFNLAVAEQANVWSETSAEAHKTVCYRREDCSDYCYSAKHVVERATIAAIRGWRSLAQPKWEPPCPLPINT